MAARSVFVNLVNRSDAVLIRISRSLSHGIWTHEPPLRIEAGAKQTWESESNGVATGTEDVLHDESEIAQVTRDCCSSGESDDELEGKGSGGGASQAAKNDLRQRRLILLHIVTDKGQLKLKE